jgi:uncharacterized protein YkwD
MAGPVRIFGVLAFAAMLAFPAGAIGQASAPRVTPSATSQVLLADLNAVRRSHNLPILRVSPELEAAARNHARSMARLGYFDHDFAGLAFASWIQRYYPQLSRRRWTAGENIIWSMQPLTPEDAVRWWMKSPAHRRNILSPEYREIGVAAVDVVRAPGVFQGLDVTIAVTDFGSRSA